MLKAVFFESGSDSLGGFEISGHAGYGTEGNDIVCAAVSSCTMLVCNCVTDSFKAKADVTVEENRITLKLSERDEPSEKLIKALYEHFSILSEDYSKIKVTLRRLSQ